MGSPWLAQMPLVSVPTLLLETSDTGDTAKRVSEFWQHGVLHSSTEVPAYVSRHDAQNEIRNAHCRQCRIWLAGAAQARALLEHRYLTSVGCDGSNVVS